MSGLISQKCLYGLKAVFDLAKFHSALPIKIAAVAARQNIPVRFLEAILRQLRQGGFVESHRGAAGGYRLARSPETITVGEIIRFFERNFIEDQSMTSGNDAGAADEAGDVLAEVYSQGLGALMSVFDECTFAGLLKNSENRRTHYIANFNI